MAHLVITPAMTQAETTTISKSMVTKPTCRDTTLTQAVLGTKTPAHMGTQPINKAPIQMEIAGIKQFKSLVITPHILELIVREIHIIKHVISTVASNYFRYKGLLARP